MDEDDARVDRLHGRRSVVFLAGDRIVEVAVSVRADEGHAAAARIGRDTVGVDVAPHNEGPGGLRAADKPVRGQDGRVVAVPAAGRAFGRPDRP